MSRLIMSVVGVAMSGEQQASGGGSNSIVSNLARFKINVIYIFLFNYNIDTPDPPSPLFSQTWYRTSSRFQIECFLVRAHLSKAFHQAETSSSPGAGAWLTLCPQEMHLCNSIFNSSATGSRNTMPYKLSILDILLVNSTISL